MKIEIANRLRPFSHLTGTHWMVPKSCLSVQIYPSLIRIFDLSGSKPICLAEIFLDIEGPVYGFTVIQDIESGSLRIFGKVDKGYFRYRICCLDASSFPKGIWIGVEKAPQEGIAFYQKEKADFQNKVVLIPGETIIVNESQFIEIEQPKTKNPFSFADLERLSLGSHKSQDWELIRRRLCFTEIFPLWHGLGQITPYPHFTELSGVSLLLERCKEKIESRDLEHILDEFLKLFLAGFQGGLSPRLSDLDFHGMTCNGYPLSSYELKNEASPLLLLAEGSKLIRSLFLQQKEEVIHFLPVLPSLFHCGRLLNVKVSHKGRLSMEWTKKALRLVSYQAIEDHSLSFQFPKSEKQCRVRTSHQDRGVTYLSGTQLDLVAGRTYWFDNVER